MSLSVLIIEDELPARARLETLLARLEPGAKVVGRVGSVKETLTWLETHEADLAFVDIQLSDDHSFEIFRRHPVTFPVIFTTAYDKFLLESFEFNSIDYLLKPITIDKLKRALAKVKLLEKHFQKNIKALVGTNGEPHISDRLIARKGTEFITVPFADIAYFYTEHKVVFMREYSGHQLMVDRNLGEWEAELDKSFFRINRKYIAHINAISRFKSDNGKVRVFLTPETREEVYVSKETAPEFRKWMKGTGH